MSFYDALLAMKQGHKAALIWWKGYWYWKDGTIRIHCEDGRDFDFRETDDPEQTLSYMASNSWEVYD